jgi:RecB family endonuclease NucS
MSIFKISSDGKAMEEFHEHDMNEEEILSLFEHHGLRFVENGLQFVDRNVPAGHGFIDTLAIDDWKRPVIIEYKIDEAASANALIQSLSYAYNLQKGQEYFARYISKKLTNLRVDGIDFDNTRIVLVAPGFEIHAEEAAQLVELPVKVVRYSICKTSENQAISTTTVFDSTSTRGQFT